MKKSMKVLSVFLVIILVFSSLSLTASAYTLLEAEGLSEYYAKHINLFAEKYGATDDEAINAIDLKVLCENVAPGGYYLCYVYGGVSIEEEGYAFVENCMFKYNAAQNPYNLGWYLINDAEVLTLAEACEKGIVTLSGEEGKLIKRCLNAPLVAEFAEVNESSEQSFFDLMNYLNRNNAYSEEHKADFVGTADEFEVVIYENTLFGKAFEETIDGYSYVAKVGQYPYGLGVYAIKDGEVLTLNEAFQKGIDLEKVNELLKGSNVTVSEGEEITTEATEPLETQPQESTGDEPATEPTEPATYTTTASTEPTESAPATEPDPTEAPDYSKFYGEIYEKFPTMKDGETATVYLYLKITKGNVYDVDESEQDALFKEREADNKAFLWRYNFDEEDILYVSKYHRQVAVNATKAQLVRLWCDSEVNSITDFEMDLGLSNGMTGADVKYALDDYMAKEKVIDSAGAYLITAGESNGIPLLKYTILPTADEVFYVRLGNYLFSATWNFTYYLGFFAVIDGEFIPFEAAWKNGDISLEDGAEIYDAAKRIENLGDMNGDGEVNIKDATLLQKALVHLEEMPKITMDFEDFKDIDVTDFNGDGALNIRDVTAIQKFIAKM